MHLPYFLSLIHYLLCFAFTRQTNHTRVHLEANQDVSFQVDPRLLVWSTPAFKTAFT